MKLKCGAHANSFQLFDDEGNDITDTMLIKSVSIQLEPNDATKAVITVYIEELEVDVDDEMLTVERKKKDGHTRQAISQ